MKRQDKFIQNKQYRGTIRKTRTIEDHKQSDKEMSVAPVPTNKNIQVIVPKNIVLDLE